VGESQTFVPAASGVTEVNVNLPVTSELITGIENVDYLALTVLGGQVPGHDTGDYSSGLGPSAGIFYPHVNLGEQNRSFGGYGGVQLLLNADWSPAQGGGGGGGGSADFSTGGPKGLKLPVTVPAAGQIGVRDAKDTLSHSLAAQAAEDSDLGLSKKAKLSLKPSSVTATGAGTFNVTLKLAGKAKKKYKQGKTAKVAAAVSFTPDGGSTSTQTLSLKLKK
jgi:hypothetical protein